MRIFTAGATGTLGRPVVRLLASRGHEVVGLTRSPERARALEAQWSRGVVGDALDREGLVARVRDARPDQVLHLLTALPPAGPTRKRQLRATNVLRTAGTANLIDASIEAGAKRLIAESFVGVYGPVNSDRRWREDEPLPPFPVGPLADSIAALRSLESQLETARAAGTLTTVALRFGFFYGPGVPGTQDLIRQARAGRLVVPRDLTGRGPFVHIEDAAAAVVSAVEHPNPSPIYNIVDDKSESLVTFVDELTRSIGVRPPRRVPRWVVRLAAPVLLELGSAMLNLSNERAKRELGWTPRFPTVDDGIAALAR